VRSRRSVVLFLLLDSKPLLAQAGERLPIAGSALVARLWARLLAFLDVHLWLAPGLIFAGIVLIMLFLWGRRRDLPQKSFKRRFHSPDLARFQGVRPRPRRDLET